MKHYTIETFMIRRCRQQAIADERYFNKERRLELAREKYKLSKLKKVIAANSLAPKIKNRQMELIDALPLKSVTETPSSD